MVEAPPEHWAHTCLIAVDEAQLVAPHMAASAKDAATRRLGVAALSDLVGRGRKRGLSPIIATRRLAKLATSVSAELHNVLVGKSIFDRDIARAADLLGWSVDRAGVLRDLAPGQFIAIGPALSLLPTTVAIGATETDHVGRTPRLTPAAAIEPDKARELLKLDTLKEATTGRRVEFTGRGVRNFDLFLLETDAALASRIVASLKGISPNATTTKDLAQHLAVDDAAITTALDLLLRWGAVECIVREDARIARLSARLRYKIAATPVVGLA
jgi:hypothetical protein